MESILLLGGELGIPGSGVQIPLGCWINTRWGWLCLSSFWGQQNECQLDGILCRSGDLSRIVPDSQGDCLGSTNALHRVWSQRMDGFCFSTNLHVSELAEKCSNFWFVPLCCKWWRSLHCTHSSARSYFSLPASVSCKCRSSNAKLKPPSSIFRSSLPRWPNKAGQNVRPPVRTSVRMSVNNFSFRSWWNFVCG